jgi:hypothetical protein
MAEVIVAAIVGLLRKAEEVFCRRSSAVAALQSSERCRTTDAMFAVEG